MLVQLNVIREVITLVVFVVFTMLAFKKESFRWNHALVGVFLVAPCGSCSRNNHGI